MLVVACPCAMVLATPVTMVSALARAARRGILVKGGIHLESLARLKVLALDKTGTLTEGRFRVVDCLPLNGTSDTDLHRMLAALLPQDKVAAVSRLRTHGVVGMLGDGINDGPALAAADIGIAMGANGTAVAMEAADVALMIDDLRRLPEAIAIGRRALSLVRFNVAFALVTKAVVMGLGLAGIANLWLAVAADMGTSLVVIGIGLSMLRFRLPPEALVAAERDAALTKLADPARAEYLNRLPTLLRALVFLAIALGLIGAPRVRGDECCPPAEHAVVAAADHEPATACYSNVPRPDSDDCTADCLAGCPCCHLAASVPAGERRQLFVAGASQHGLERQRAPPQRDPEGLLQVPKAA